MSESPAAHLLRIARRHPWRTGLAGVATGLLLGSGLFWVTLPDVSGLATGWPDTTAYMQLRIEQARESDRSLELHYRPVPLERIPDHLQRAVRWSEDAGFYGHQGVDWAEVENALSEAWEERRFPRGASTITQQLARNLYLSPTRSPWRKLRELFIARRLEEELSKRRILELYLNVIELGDGVFGVGAAARRYFGVPVHELSPEQSLRIAAAIPAPRTHNPATDTRRFRWRVGVIRNRLAAVERGSSEPARAAPRSDPASSVPPAPDSMELPVPDTIPSADTSSADTSAAQPPDAAASMRDSWARYSGREERSTVSAARRKRSM